MINIGNYSLQGQSKITDINVDTGNTVYKSIDGNLYSYDGTTLIQYALGKTESSFTVPDGVTNIGAGAFYSCSLSSIILPDGVTTIGKSAFGYSLSLTDINIPDSVTTIGNQAFTSTAIQSITISSGVTFIDKTVFADCPLLISVTFENTSGWYVTETEGAASGIKISDSSLSDTAMMANYLNNTYVSYYWYRSEN